MIHLLILIITLLYVIIIVDFIRGWRKLKEFIPQPGVVPQIKFSVIVPARNEATNIKNVLTDLVNQSYPSGLFEIIVVDDFSGDYTIEEASSIKAPNIRIISLKDELGFTHESSKKFAINHAIGKSTGEWIVTTDADCRIQKNWLNTIAAFIEEKKPNTVCAPVGLIEGKGLLDHFQVIDIAAMTAITGACLANKFANMCNGANMAYRKSIYDQVGGFGGNEKQPSGDDMFLMHKIAKKYPDSVQFLKSKEVIVRTYPQPDFHSFKDQRVRWLSKSSKLSDKWVTLHLVVAYLFNFFIIVGGLYGLFNHHYLLLSLLMIFIKLALEFPFMYWALDFLGQASLIVWYVPVQLLHIVYVTVFGVMGIFAPYNWKGRKHRTNAIAR